MKKNTTTVYKIRNKETGEFSKGGSFAHSIWGKKSGKTWANLGALKNHLRFFLTWQGLKKNDYPYENAEVIEVEINYKECNKYDVENIIQGMVGKGNDI